jgi:hypothetical protein
MQQLTTFEAMLVDRLNATGQVQAKSFMAGSFPALYGVLVLVDGATVPYRLTKGSGTGDPPMTEAEQEAHAAHLAAVKEGNPPRLQFTPAQERKASDLIRDVLAVDPPPGSVHVEGPVDGREQPGVKVRYSTASEIYIVPAKV